MNTITENIPTIYKYLKIAGAAIGSIYGGYSYHKYIRKQSISYQQKLSFLEYAIRILGNMMIGVTYGFLAGATFPLSIIIMYGYTALGNTSAD